MMQIPEHSPTAEAPSVPDAAVPQKVSRDQRAEPYGLMIVAGFRGRHVYSGEVSRSEIDRRRAKNKAARAARRRARR